MITIPITASRTYEVRIGSGLLAELGSQSRELVKAETAVVVSDSTVFPLYGEYALSSLKKAGFRCLSFVFPAGEESKSAATYLSLLGFLAEKRITRSDLLVALGGGVVGDLTGFAAATYLRGIPYIQVPTTLLSAVDSSVGGKTAIDLPEGKNLVGAFYQPSLVICDTDTLNTLPEDIFLDGCAEVIKYGILFDPTLFSALEESGPAFSREQVIAACVKWKRDVVAQDEFDTGLRKMLNLGHTVGHGVEAGSQFALSHGKSVAIGTAIVTRAAASKGICSKETETRILRCLEKFSLPVRTDFSPEQLAAYALSDKKRRGGTVDLILPRQIGDCIIVPTSVEDIQSLIEAGV